MQAEGAAGEQDQGADCAAEPRHHGAMAGDPKEGVLTSCSTKATLDGVVFIMRSTGSSFMHMAAATAIRKGTKLKACVLAPGAVVLYLSSAPCRWHWHAQGLPCSGTAKPALQETEEQQP